MQNIFVKVSECICPNIHWEKVNLKIVCVIFFAGTRSPPGVQSAIREENTKDIKQKVKRYSFVMGRQYWNLVLPWNYHRCVWFSWIFWSFWFFLTFNDVQKRKNGLCIWPVQISFKNTIWNLTSRSNDLLLRVNIHDHMSYEDKNWVQSEYYAQYLHNGVKYVSYKKILVVIFFN